MKVARIELNQTERQTQARHSKEHKLTAKESLRITARKPVLDDKVYPNDPIFKNIQRASKPGKKTQRSILHDRILYSKP